MKEKDGLVNLSHTTPWGPLASSEIPQRAFLLLLLLEDHPELGWSQAGQHQHNHYCPSLRHTDGSSHCKYSCGVEVCVNLANMCQH